MDPDSTPEQQPARRSFWRAGGLGLAAIIGLGVWLGVWLGGWFGVIELGRGDHLDPPEFGAARAEMIAALNTKLNARGDGVALDQRLASLRWRAPGDCVERYRFSAVTVVAGERVDAAAWQLEFTTGAAGPEARVTTETSGSEFASRSGPERVRELWFGPTGHSVGPAAPDLACRLEVLDPLEDALAFAWPALPRADPTGRSAVGDGWPGHAVAGRCHAWACADDQGQLRPDDPSCRAGPWREQLAGAGLSSAVLTSAWQTRGDPGPPGAAILTSRAVLITDGRPRLAVGAVVSRVHDARLELALERLDDCPTPVEGSALTRLRARLRAFAGNLQRPHT